MKALYVIVFVVVLFVDYISSYPFIQPPWNQQYVPAQLAQYGPYGPPYSNPVYDPTLKWPAVPYNAPANYPNYGKYNSDAWLLPQNVPRFYDQTDGSRLVQGRAGYLWPLFYGR